VKFEIQQEALQKSLDLVSGIVPSKTTVPILRCILVEAKKDAISFSVTNLDVSMVTIAEEVKIAEEGRVAVTADKLTNFVRSLSPGNVVFCVEENMLKVRSGKASCEIPCSNTEEYPSLPALVDIEAYEIRGSVLGGMIAETSYAVSRDETRPALMGILWEVSDEGLTMVATDAHRLSRSRRVMEWGKAERRQMIVDTSGLRQLSRVVSHGEDEGDVEIFFGDNQLSFRMGKTILHTRLLEGPFPDYNAVIPKGNDKLINIDREVLAQAIRRVSIIADRLTNQVRMVFRKGRLELSARGADGSRAEDEIDIGYDGDEMEIGFNFAYLLDVLKSMQTESVQMSLRDTNSAALLMPLREDGESTDSLLCLLMPLRLAGD
jgi:DNA polymerase III subunit beta